MPPNKRLERPGVSTRADVMSTRAGRSVARRWAATKERVW